MEIPTGAGRILFVDDEVSITKLSKRLLEKLGYHVTLSNSSLDALALFKGDPSLFDLVITDMTMPDMTGDLLAKEILKIIPDMPIILCTGYNKHISEKNVRKLGIRLLMHKPIDICDIAVKIKEMLEAPKKGSPA